MPNLHLGINTCFAVKRWPEPQRWLRIVKEFGLDCCQFSFDLIDPLLDETVTAAYADTAREQAAAEGIFIHSAFTGLAAYSWSQLLHPDEAMREAAMRWYERAIDFTARLGASGMGGHLGAFSAQDAADEARQRLLLAELEQRLTTLSRYAAQRGLNFLLFENMAVPREWGYSIEQAQQLTGLALDGVPLVLCLDLGHPCALHTGTASDDYLAWLNVSWPHTPILHLQQSDRTGDHHWPFTTACNAQGLVQAPAVLDALQHWPARDIYLFLEPIHPFEADDNIVLQDLHESVQYWRDAMK
jgi:sugar phosphate isomerase/epimerase